MGLIKAGVGAIGGVLADQWKEFFSCNALSNDVLVAKGVKNTSARSSNTKGSDNVITSGSGIIVADGQCMMIVEQGKVVEVCAEPGQFIYDNSIAPTVFSGNLGESIMATFKEIGKRFTYGGQAAADQRVYYFNTKELMDNKFGTPSPIMFRVVDHNIKLDLDVSLRCSGLYSYRITDPLLFYTNVTGNVDREYRREEIDNQLKTEFISALQPALAKISELQVRPSALPAHAEELSMAMNQVLTQKWAEKRGISVVSVAMNPITLTEEYEEMLRQAQGAAIYRDANMAGAAMTAATADAMRSAAENPNGAFMGYMGMGMAQQAGGVDTKALYEMGQKQQVQEARSHQESSQAGARSWTCPDCQTSNTGNFCSNCGKEKPAVSAAKFCSNCGWQVTDPSNPPKFCPECGTAF
ncbi:band 7 domain superfamily protein; membrane protease [Streptococcus varani]|uniref:Band 7 domain superfamily protein membrane protease n=1 Tax=Streptococcus varani TaxID=1608583 RepID=A0A0E4CSJ0_9STRE|nr:SPFH domain-containing protein [Streptococcus varani]CQR24698.1 band 7 domain superfamily protein; membrane protease [Streptococcus varani]